VAQPVEVLVRLESRTYLQFDQRESGTAHELNLGVDDSRYTGATRAHLPTGREFPVNVEGFRPGESRSIPGTDAKTAAAALEFSGSAFEELRRDGAGRGTMPALLPDVRLADIILLIVGLL
jgi:hypothetical protein